MLQTLPTFILTPPLLITQRTNNLQTFTSQHTCTSAYMPRTWSVRTVLLMRTGPALMVGLTGPGVQPGVYSAKVVSQVYASRTNSM